MLLSPAVGLAIFEIIWVIHVSMPAQNSYNKTSVIDIDVTPPRRLLTNSFENPWRVSFFEKKRAPCVVC